MMMMMASWKSGKSAYPIITKIQAFQNARTKSSISNELAGLYVDKQAKDNQLAWRKQCCVS